MKIEYVDDTAYASPVYIVNKPEPLVKVHQKVRIDQWRINWRDIVFKNGARVAKFNNTWKAIEYVEKSASDPYVLVN